MDQTWLFRLQRWWLISILFLLAVFSSPPGIRAQPVALRIGISKTSPNYENWLKRSDPDMNPSFCHQQMRYRKGHLEPSSGCRPFVAPAEGKCLFTRQPGRGHRMETARGQIIFTGGTMASRANGKIKSAVGASCR